MTLSTTERLKTLKDIEIDNIISIGKNIDPTLSFSPRVLIFQNVKINECVTTKFSVMNISKVRNPCKICFIILYIFVKS